MTNYWLSEYEDGDYDEPENGEPEDDEEDDEEKSGPKSKLNPRQLMLYEHYEHITEMFGPFDQSAQGNGAHYAPSAKNPFVKEGMVCSNCVFFMGGQACEIVKGTIEPNAICKLWIIPEELITIKR
jgi:hypothetical protein